MFISFNTLPPNARLWIYQADRPLDLTEEKVLSATLHEFCEAWEAHGQPLKTSFSIQHHQFIVLAVDQNFNDASGCSIDGSVRILKSFQESRSKQNGANKIDFFDRSKIAFLMNQEIKTFPLRELKDLFASGRLTNTSVSFNNLVATKADFDRNWLTSAGNSWLAKYLPKPTVV